MENRQSNIDQFYREALAGHKAGVSDAAWGKMKWRLLWLDFKYYVFGFAALVMVGTAFYFGINPNTQTPEAFSESSPPTIQTEQSPIIYQSEDEETETITQDNLLPPYQPVNDQSTQGIEEHLDQTLLTENNDTRIDEVNENDYAHDDRLYSLNYLNTRKGQYGNITYSNEELISGDLLPDSISYPYHDIRKTSWLSVSLYAAPAYTTSTLSSDAIDNEYLNYRRDHESGKISWSAGVNLQFNIKNWFIQTGLGYSVLSENRNYNHTFQELDDQKSYYTNDTTWAWVYDPPDIGKPIVLGIDSVFVPVYNDFNEGKNEWRYLEIPLLAGYNFHVNRFSFEVGMGVSYALLLSADGNVPSFSNENEFDELSDLESSMNKHNFNYLLQLGISYHITPKWSLTLAPYYKQSLQSVFDNDYPIDQRFKSFGVKFGLKVDLY